MTPQHMDEWAEAMRERALENFNRDGYLTPTTLILASVNPTNGETVDPPMVIPVVMTHMTNDAEKNAYVKAVKDISKLSNALAICMITESWMAVAADAGEIRKLVKAGLENARGRMEAIHFSYERRGVSETRVWFAVISRADGKPVAGAFHESKTTGGRFIGLMENDSVQ